MQIQYLNEYRNNKKITKKLFIILSFIVVIILLILLISYFIFLGVKNISKSSFDNKQYKKLFVDKNYSKLIEELNKSLIKKPFNKEYLVYRGYSYFFLAEEEENASKKKIYLTFSLVDLRKVLSMYSEKKIDNNILFVIGKLYYYLGEPYYNQSIKYLKKAQEYGNNRVDLLYLLGLIYSFTGDYNESIKVYQDALKIEESEILILALANAYFKANKFDEAKSYLTNIVKNSNDSKIKERSYFILGELYFQENNFQDALNYFNNALEINNNNADAYFYRGEIYFKLNNIIKARADWRKTLEIEPSHIKALKRIYY